MPDIWPAPAANAPVDAELTLPGSKSLTNRYLVLAALADTPTVLRRPLRARDTELMAAGLRAIGVEIQDVGEDWHVFPSSLRGPAMVDCGLAGTVMRFLPPVAALAEGSVAFDGDAHARERPMRPVIHSLRTLGAEIDDAESGRLPFTVSGRGALPGGDVVIDASASSQFLSALLLSAPRFDAGLRVTHVGAPIPSLPHIAMSLELLRAAGVDAAATGPHEWTVAPGKIELGEVHVEPDLSNAAAFLAAAMITGGTVRIHHWPERSTQPGLLLPLLLGRMGAETSWADGTLTLRGTGEILGLDEDLRDVGELVPVLAAVAALASTPSSLRGIAHLRGHETDRLAALRTELNGLGGAVEETEDGLLLSPAPLHGGRFETYADHRMATAGAVLGLVVPGVEVVDIATTGKTLPNFTGRWSAMLAGSPS